MSENNKRSRRIRTNVEQHITLLDLMAIHYPLLSGNECNPGYMIRRKEVWENIAEELNQLGPPKTPGKWKASFSEMRSKLKRKIDHMKMGDADDYGEVAELDLTDLEKVLCTICAFNSPGKLKGICPPSRSKEVQISTHGESLQLTGRCSPQPSTSRSIPSPTPSTSRSIPTPTPSLPRRRFHPKPQVITSANDVSRQSLQLMKMIHLGLCKRRVFEEEQARKREEHEQMIEQHLEEQAKKRDEHDRKIEEHLGEMLRILNSRPLY